MLAEAWSCERTKLRAEVEELFLDEEVVGA